MLLRANVEGIELMRVALLVMLLTPFLSGCVAEEGDFTIKMPGGGLDADSADIRELVALEIRLIADDRGDLSGVFLDGQQLVVDEGDDDVFDVLNRRVRNIVEKPDGRAVAGPDFEAVIHVEGELEYAFVVEAISAVSGYVGPDDTVHRLVPRIRFAETRAE